ncbi:MAG: hypothetical protein V3R95_09370 [Dehalococcoidia bacterium]
MIVVGRVTEFARAPEFDRLRPENSSHTLELVVLSVTFEVDQYLKGAGPTTLVTYDGDSAYYRGGPGEQFSETDVDGLYYGGDCGVLNANPLGEYRVAGLLQSSDGVLTMWAFPIATAESADDPAITEAIERAKKELTALGLTFPPGTGGAGLASDGGEAGFPAALLLLAVLAGAAGARRVVARDSR